MSEYTFGLPWPVTRYSCPLGACLWTHDDPGPSGTASGMAGLRDHLVSVEAVIRAHLETHPPEEQQLLREAAARLSAAAAGGITAYDLAPPAHWPVPKVLPLLDRGERSPMPRYVPGPQPPGTVRVVLDSAGCDGEPADFRLYGEYPVTVEPYRVFDVPAGQYERWAEARAAFGVMQEEIEAAVRDRARNASPRPSPGLPF